MCSAASAERPPAKERNVSFYSDFADDYETIFPWRRSVHDALIGLLPSAPARVLDLGCGTGHYCGRMAAAGHDALGLDSDPAMIAAAARAYPDARFRTLDIARLETLAAEPPFAAAWCLGNVLPHVDPAGLPAMFAGLAAVLRPGAAWIVQTVNWDAVLDAGRDPFVFPDRELPGGLVFARRYEGLATAGAPLRFITRLSRGDMTVFAGETRLFPLRATLLRELAAAAGFRFEAAWGDYDRRPFAPGSSAAAIHVFRRG